MGLFVGQLHDATSRNQTTMNTTEDTIPTAENPVRYERLEKSDPNYREKFAAQLDQFEEDAKAGKVVCLSDLMCSAGM